jgi:hypothetical protein
MAAGLREFDALLVYGRGGQIRDQTVQKQDGRKNSGFHQRRFYQQHSSKLFTKIIDISPASVIY